jgi:hypothetical protein
MSKSHRIHLLKNGDKGSNAAFAPTEGRLLYLSFRSEDIAAPLKAILASKSAARALLWHSLASYHRDLLLGCTRVDEVANQDDAVPFWYSFWVSLSRYFPDEVWNSVDDPWQSGRLGSARSSNLKAECDILMNDLAEIARRRIASVHIIADPWPTSECGW